MATAANRVLPANAPPLQLKITPNSDGSAVILSWPSIYVGYYLEQNSDLSPGNWIPASGTISDTGTTRSVTIDHPPDNLFYRLCRPGYY